MKLLVLLLATALMPLSAMAQEKNILDLPSGHTLLNIAATEQVETEQDLLIANLRIEHEDEVASKVQDHINKLMAAAVSEAKKVESTEINTGYYNVHQYTQKPRQVKIWRGSQSLTLKSKNAEDLLELTGKLQDLGLLMNGLTYTLSNEKSQEIRDSLMEAALEKLSARADRAGKALNKNSYEFLEVNVDSNGFQASPRPMMMRAASMEMAMDSVAAPVAESGKTSISLSVNARVLLKP